MNRHPGRRERSWWTLKTRQLRLEITLDQRVQLRYHIPAPALSPQEASGYIRRHLEHAGRTDTLFSDVIQGCQRASATAGDGPGLPVSPSVADGLSGGPPPRGAVDNRAHPAAASRPRAINKLSAGALLAAYSTGKTIVDESSARTAISEEAAAATD